MRRRPRGRKLIQPRKTGSKEGRKPTKDTDPGKEDRTRTWKEKLTIRGKEG